jgi:alpha-ribazole phosphatase
MNIYLIRHSKPDVPDGVFYGQSDINVTKPEFQQTVSRIREKIDHVELEMLYTSPLKRCSSLAQQIAPDHSKIHTDERIMELHFGEWELKHLDDIDKKEMERWTNDFVHAQVPGGESHQHLYNRVAGFWDKMVSQPEETLAVVTHGGVIKSILSKVLQMPLRKSYSVKIHYGELLLIQHYGNDQYSVEFLTAPE